MLLLKRFYLLIPALLFFFFGCQTTPPATPLSVRYPEKKGISLPAEARMSVFMNTDDIRKKYKIRGRRYLYELEEGRKIQAAALKVFDRLFHDISPHRDSTRPHIIGKIKGLTYINPVDRELKRNDVRYSADDTVTLYYGNGKLIGRFNGTGTELSPYLTDEIAIENAHIRAFEEISNQMLQNEKLLWHFRNGFSERLTGDPTESILHGKEHSKFRDFFKSIFLVRTEKRTGSGFFISPHGFAVTDKRIVENDHRPAVKTFGGRATFAKVVAIHPVFDIAIMKIDMENSGWLELDSNHRIDIGNEVVAIGNPFSLDYTVSQGNISSKRTVGNGKYLEIDAELDSGYIGGPLISLETGKVVGLITWGSEGRGFDSRNIAISSREIIRFTDKLPRLSKKY